MEIVLSDKLNDCIIESLADGEGIRLVIFLQGCSHYCEGCHNYKTWNIENGIKYPVTDVANALLSKLKKHPRINGITISGGDPFFQKESLIQLLKLIREENLDINIWVYTGYELEDIGIEDESLKYIDVLVTGKFEKNNQYPRLKFRGSRNQKLYRLEKDKFNNTFVKTID